MTPEYVETGGLRWGGSNLTWPFARLTATADDIEISRGFWKWWRPFVHFSKSEVQAIRRTRCIVGVGVVIEHYKEGYPSFIVFWSFNCRRLKNALARLGYPISDTGGPWLVV
jgi:hypothetical protein